MSDDVPQAKPPAAERDGDEEEVVDAGPGEGEDEAPEPDEGPEADLGDDEGQDDEGPARQVAEPTRRSETARRVSRLNDENRDLRNRVADFERQLAQLTQQQRQPTQAELAEAERREAEAVSMMAPAEVAKYYSDKSERRIADRLNQIQMQNWDQADSAKFDGIFNSEPGLADATPQLKADLRDRVEAMRRVAPNVSREYLLKIAYTEYTWERAKGARTRARNRSEAQAAQHRVRAPSNGRGDVAAPQERGGSGDRWARLRNVQI